MTPPSPSAPAGSSSTDQTPDSKDEADLSENTTRAQSPVGGEDEKKGTETASSLKEESLGSDAIEYPTGWSFTFIVVALVLSIFLISLDMVR